ncbi:MAG: hypothetical protein ACK4K0_03485 [Flavobacteriales bacterium]
MPNHIDTIQSKKELPFFIHESKKIPNFELEEKKEGTFVKGGSTLRNSALRVAGKHQTI